MERKEKTPIMWQTGRKERHSYLVYFTGQNIFYELIAGYLTTYLILTGINMVKVGVVVMIVKVWDAVNDALFGAVFDKIKFKNGQKCLPWVRISTVLIPIASVLLFAIPRSAGENLQILWFAVAYLFWDTAYTICDVPIYTMITTITSDLQERNTLMSVRHIFSTLGMGITGVAITILAGENVGMNYTSIAVLLSVLAAILMSPISVLGKERNYTPNSEDENFTMGQMFSYLCKNKYLLLYYGGYIVANALLTHKTLGLIVSYYLFGNSMFSLVIGAISTVPQLLASAFLPLILKRTDKFKVYFACNVATIILGFIIFFAGYENMLLFLILTGIRAFPACAIGVMNFMFTPDCAEYGRFKTGTDAKGITFAIQTFSAKITSAIASSLSLIILGFFHWKEVSAASFKELAEMGITQTPEALRGLWITYALVPVLGYVFALIFYSFYKLKDKDVQIMAKCNAGEITREEAETMLSVKY